MKVRAKCVPLVFNISKFCETGYRLYITLCVTFIQLGANIYDNPSYLKIMKHFSNTRVNKRLRKVAKSDYYLYRICLSVRKVHLCSHWTNFLDILDWEKGCLIINNLGDKSFILFNNIACRAVRCFRYMTLS